MYFMQYSNWDEKRHAISVQSTVLENSSTVNNLFIVNWDGEPEKGWSLQEVTKIFKRDL